VCGSKSKSPIFTHDSAHFSNNDRNRGITPSGILGLPGLNRSNPLESDAPWLTTRPGPAYQVLAPQVGGPEGTRLPRASMPNRASMPSFCARRFQRRGKPCGLSLRVPSYWPSHLDSRLFRVQKPADVRPHGIFRIPFRIGSHVDPLSVITGKQNAFRTHTTGSPIPLLHGSLPTKQRRRSVYA